MTNEICATCSKALNSINGRYCLLLKKYVEHSQKPSCKTIKTDKQ